MIVYHAITTYHILKFAVHKLIYHPDAMAVLLIPNFLVRTVSGLEETLIFEKIVKFDWERKSKGLNQTEIFQYIENSLSDSLPINIKKAKQIYVARAEYFFGSWLCEENLPFDWFEEADGRLSFPEPIMIDDARLNPIRHQLAVERGLYTGDNPCIQRKYVKFSAQKHGFFDAKALDFDIVKELKKLDEHGKSTLLRFFDVPEDLTIQTNSVLMLTQHFANLRILSYEDHILMYQLTTDYFLDGYNLYYKWHPSDWMPYPSFINNVTMIPGHFPSELLALVCTEPFAIGASINSTGILNLENMYERVLTFNQEYNQTFKHNHQYYFCKKLMEQLSTFPVAHLNMNSVQLQNIVEFGKNEEMKPKCEIVSLEKSLSDIQIKPQLYLIGDCPQEDRELLLHLIEKGHPQSVYVFLDLEENGSFLPFVSDFLPVVKEIILSPIASSYKGFETEKKFVYCFTRDSKVRGIIQEMHYTKKLINAGIETAVFASEDKDLQIAILKGMLKATEHQMKILLQENEKLKKEIGS